MQKTYSIDVDCANCANKMEAAAAKTPGVRSAVVNFMAQRLTVEFEDGAVPQQVMADMVKRCRRVAHDCEIYL